MSTTGSLVYVTTLLPPFFLWNQEWWRCHRQSKTPKTFPVSLDAPLFLLLFLLAFPPVSFFPSFIPFFYLSPPPPLTSTLWHMPPPPSLSCATATTASDTITASILAVKKARKLSGGTSLIYAVIYSKQGRKWERYYMPYDKLPQFLTYTRKELKHAVSMLIFLRVFIN